MKAKKPLSTCAVFERRYLGKYSYGFGYWENKLMKSVEKP
jgi:hypothetical protein